jgi:membrane protease YdiL (CAAX protease family)
MSDAIRPADRPSVRDTLLALALVFLPYLHALWIHLTGRGLSVAELFLYPLLLGGAEVAIILILIRLVFRERVGDLNRKPGRWFRDIASGLLLLVVSFAVMLLHSVLLAPLLPQPAAPPAVVTNLLHVLSKSPVLLVVWLGPVVWIGVALFEELSRVFFLDRLWKLWPGPTGRWTAVVLSAGIWGVVHIYQGLSSVVSVFLLGLVYALYYLRFGRVWPLVIAHALFDSVQILSAVG